jgi:hypothetical protein
MEDRNKRRLDLSSEPTFRVSDDSDFPASRKIEMGELRVPARVIQLEAGEPPLTVYDTSGPRNADPRLVCPPDAPIGSRAGSRAVTGTSRNSITRGRA